MEETSEHQSYQDTRIILGHVNLTFSIIMLISNTLLIITLSRKNTASSTNRIFTHLAIVESLATISYLPRLWHEFYRVTQCSIKQEHRTYVWEMISLYSGEISFTFQQIGLWMMIMLAVWRYIEVIHPQKKSDWCDKETTRRFILAGYIFGMLLLIPIYFIPKVWPVEEESVENHPALFTITALLYAGIKLLPSVAFAIISYKLIMARKNTPQSENDDNTLDSGINTALVITILVLFVVVEIPHGIVCLFIVYQGPKSMGKYYCYGEGIFNILIQISECFNFVVYYAMRHQLFEKIFRVLFGLDGKGPETTNQMVISSPSCVYIQTELPSVSSNIISVEAKSVGNRATSFYESYDLINEDV
ncbi:sex peptide receptor-like [Planococcus citri]|uniref:sex peptide receptor-like n=1 Tax=Planococcus citri TaxID=170843 RepID=UPI0031F8757D